VFQEIAFDARDGSSAPLQPTPEEKELFELAIEDMPVIAEKVLP